MSAIPEILDTYARAFGDLPWHAWVAPVVALLFVALRFRAPRIPARRAGALTACVVLLGVVHAWQRAWVGDDAFIAFRYARNLVEGNGLVYNVGERVEGYTDFLWVLLVAAAMALGIHAVHAALIMGIACFAAAMVLVQRLTIAEVEGLEANALRRLPVLGLVLVAGNRLLADYGTSGLETMFAGALVLLALDCAQRDRPLAAGLLGVCATLAHPDHAIYYAAIGAALLLSGSRLPALIRYAVPFFVVFVPYFLWRWRYYGDLVPNTYHAKEAGTPYWSQGVVYVVACALAMGLWAWTPLVAVGAWARRRSVVVLACVLALPLSLLYTMRIGGDFMLGRLLITPTLLLALLAGIALEALVARGPRRAGALLAAVACAALVPVTLVPPQDVAWHLADEATHYRLASFSPPRIDSKFAQEADVLTRQLLARDLRPKLAHMCIGIIGWQTDLPIFDMFGLTSRAVALSPIAQRGRPGHEKRASAGQILESGTTLSRMRVFPRPYEVITTVTLEDQRYYLTAFADDLAVPLAALGRTRDARSVLAHLVELQSTRDPRVRECDAWFAREYYFRHQQDPALASAWAATIPGDLPPEVARGVVVEGRDPRELGYAITGAVHFDDLTGWAVEGAAFAGNPVTAPSPGEEAVIPRTSGFVDSFAPATGFGAVGRLVSQPFVVDGDISTVYVGGYGGKARVSLVVDGRPVRLACGCGTKLLRQVVWDVRDVRGRTAVLELIDDDVAGDLVVDELVIWRRVVP